MPRFGFAAFFSFAFVDRVCCVVTASLPLFPGAEALPSFAGLCLSLVAFTCPLFRYPSGAISRRGVSKNGLSSVCLFVCEHLSTRGIVPFLNFVLLLF